MKKIIKIGLLGLGTVGSAVYDLIKKNTAVLQTKLPGRIEIKKIGVRQLRKIRKAPKNLLTTNLKSIVQDPEIDIIVELIGNRPQVFPLLKQALKNGKAVVTANKAVIAKHALELFRLATKYRAPILFEASVGGGIPILKTLREGIAANRILVLRGIINGTSNYILSEMESRGLDFNTALKTAQKLGYAEANPQNDIEGQDAAAKLCILILLSQGRFIPVEKIFCQGITQINSLDIEMARRFDYRIKLMGITKLVGKEIEARVHPVMISEQNPIAHVCGAFNAVQYIGDYVGEGMLYGCGAGGKTTASAVVADVLEIARSIRGTSEPSSPIGFDLKYLKKTLPRDHGELICPYYLRFTVLDRPKVLSQLTGILGKHKISIQHIYQHGGPWEGLPVSVIAFTHEACEKNMQKAIQEINRLKDITQKTQIIRIET